MENALDALISCETRCNDRGLNTDHIHIVTKLDVMMSRTQETTSNNFRNVDWEKFREHLQGRMANLRVPTQIRNQVSLNKECERLTAALQETIEAMVLTMEVCPKSKHWWTKEIGELREIYRKLRRKAGKYKDQPEH